jgi:hypothetical protein
VAIVWAGLHIESERSKNFRLIMEKAERTLLILLLTEYSEKLRKRGELLFQTQRKFSYLVCFLISICLSFLLISQFFLTNFLTRAALSTIFIPICILKLDYCLKKSHYFQNAISVYAFKQIELIKILQEQKEKEDIGFACRIELDFRLSEAQEVLDFCQEVYPSLRERLLPTGSVSSFSDDRRSIKNGN